MFPRFIAILGAGVLMAACTETTEALDPTEITDQNYVAAGKYDNGGSGHSGAYGTPTGLAFSTPLCNRKSPVLIAGNRYCLKSQR